MFRTSVPVVLLAAAASAQDHPQSMLDLCKNNIISWAEIPHDWQPESENHLWKGDGSSAERYRGKDWWYWKDDWKQRIATGDQAMEPMLAEEYAHAVTNNKPLVGKCGQGSSLLATIPSVETTAECRQACAFEYSTQSTVREKCQFFSYEAATEQCILYANCRWNFDTSDNQAVDDIDDRNCYGTEGRAGNCSWGEARIWKTYRIVDIYPAGFQSFSLREFNEPPLCIHVPDSSDKKVEVMIETEMNDSRVCVMDGRDMGVYTNDVGNVRTCDNGKLYSCFTAATSRTSGSGPQDFYFYISCEGSCEASDVDVWIRLRKSQLSWDIGKQDWESDIEYWCEHERGTEAAEKNRPNKIHPEFMYPSELLPEQPQEYPYRITNRFDDSAASASSALWAIVVAAVMALAALR